MAKQNINWKNVVEDYFTFAKFQRRAVITLLIGIILLFIVPAFWNFFVGSKTEKANDIVLTAAKELKAKADENKEEYKQKERPDYASYREPNNGKYNNKTVAELFPFDPNTATVDVWKRLGIRDKTAATIVNYISKGGHFYKPEDLNKIYGLHEDEVQRLMPYVRIAAVAKTEYKKEEGAASTSKSDFTKPTYPSRTIDINSADTTAFISLPGIGSKLAARIVNYRDKLGGFYSINQIGETYGLADSTFQKIKSRFTISGTVRKININTATAAEMKMPYLSYNVINAIVQFRSQHGSFKSVEDIKKIMLVDEATFNKIAPYLKVD